MPHSAPAPKGRGVGVMKRIVSGLPSCLYWFMRAVSRSRESEGGEVEKIARGPAVLMRWVRRSSKSSDALVEEGSLAMAKLVGRRPSRSRRSLACTAVV